jgi:hypothetical protein
MSRYAAKLAVGSKPGGPFKRVDKATYALADFRPSQKATSRPQKRSRPPEQRRSIRHCSLDA